MSRFLFDDLWPGLLTATILYVSDYGMTLACARLYRAGADQKVAMDGSYEITPYFQSDIDKLTRLSPRFIFALALLEMALILVWLLAKETPEFYQFALGYFILLELAIHVRHMRNFVLFRGMLTDQVIGRIEYERSFMLRVSSMELLAFSGLFLLTFAFTLEPFVLGGSVGCFLTALKHRVLARKQAARPAAGQV